MGPNWFVGFPVDPGNWYQKVITNVPAGIKCFHPDDLHITLAFLGAAGPEKSTRAWNEIVKANLHAMEITLASMAPFGNPEKPSAYAFTLNMGRTLVTQVMNRYQKRLLILADKGPEKYAPRPHVTIARPPRDATDALRKTGLQWALDVPPPTATLTLDRIALYTWSEDRKTRQFKVAASVLLSNTK